MEKYSAPTLLKPAFHCPHCHVHAEQTWSIEISCSCLERYPFQFNKPTLFQLSETSISICSVCGKNSIWILEKMIYPLAGNVEIANADLPEDIKTDYNEARNIINISPKGAAALLRLIVQKLCIHIGEKGRNINDDIGNLVKRGLPIHVQQALDIVRVSGNHAVHPGTIESSDNLEKALSLFGLINLLCDYFISQPKMIDAIYSNLPEKDRIIIAKRDN